MKRQTFLSLGAFALTTLAAGGERVAFDWFEYRAEDPFYDAHPLAEGEYYNPILPGFYPDPSIVRVGEDYYLVNSTFAWYPGVPIFHSRDLVHWEQLGHVLDRPGQLNLDGHRISRGIFAPTIDYHDGRFYMVTTLVDTLGNFFVTATDPAGPWSDPVVLPEVDGIDPSFFFDDHGKAWLVNNGPPPDNQPLYDGHRAIWIQEFDVAAQKLVGPRQIIVNGGVDLAQEPSWIEGPHLFKHRDWYYLQCAEGGTSVNHRQVVFRGRAPTGPFEPWEGNPMLTQRDFPANRPNAVAATGHADLVELSTGDWWAVFLGTRPYQDDDYGTGRQTFLLPVAWTADGWPWILPAGEAVPLKRRAPELPEWNPPGAMGQGNFTWRDDFEGARLRPDWAMMRTPRGEPWWSLGEPGGILFLEPLSAPLADKGGQPSFLGRRLQHHDFSAGLAVGLPASEAVEAGMCILLDENHYYFAGVRRRGGGVEAFVEKADGSVEEPVALRLLAAASWHFRLVGRGSEYRFAVSSDGEAWTELGSFDARVLTITNAWGFTGAMLGPYARTR